MGIQNAVKEWAGVVNALGEGNQLVIVRRYPPRTNDLLLYPTFNYYNSHKTERASFDEKFQPAFSERAWIAGKYAMERGQKECLVDVDYWAHVDEVLSVQDQTPWKLLSPFFIWSSEHVENYAKGSKTGNVLLWILRVQKLPKTLVLGRIAQGGPPDFYKHHETIDTTGSKPVLRDAEYEERKAQILKITGKKGLSVSKS